MKEATILINNVLLDEAQSSSLRVAVASFLTELAEPDHMAALGEIGPLYQARLSEVQDLIFKGEAERRARALAEKKHAGQTYNGGRDPYTVHLDAVHDLAERVGLPEPLLVAAYLHDVLEDTPVKYEELKDRFGAQVAESRRGRHRTRQNTPRAQRGRLPEDHRARSFGCVAQDVRPLHQRELLEAARPRRRHTRLLQSLPR